MNGRAGAEPEKCVRTFRLEGDVREWHLLLPGDLQTACGIKTNSGYGGYSSELVVSGVSCERCRRSKAWKSMTNRAELERPR